MSLRAVWVLLACVLSSCGGDSMRVKQGEPQTAREKMLAEQKAKPEEDQDPSGKKWSGWRYQGERKECFFLVGRRCFKTEKAACQAARCKAKCLTEGAGPAMLKCEGEVAQAAAEKPADKPAKTEVVDEPEPEESETVDMTAPPQAKDDTKSDKDSKSDKPGKTSKPDKPRKAKGRKR
jgi:hypothetical protein